MNVNELYSSLVRKALVVLFLAAFGNTTYLTLHSRNICSSHCTQWDKKLYRHVYFPTSHWETVCVKSMITCCPGYEGPYCEKACISCDIINGLQRDIVSLCQKITTIEETFTNRQSSVDGNESYFNCSCPAGPPGAQGSPGPQGLPGKKGPQGTKGDSGLQGHSGQPGLNGTPGAKGSIGFPGLPGMDGKPGDPGEHGLTGNPGMKGNPGVPGPKGEQGFPGPPGFTESNGLVGEKGEKGLPGDQGKQGQKGLSGRDGQNGSRENNGTPTLKVVKGDQGSSGQKGEIGLPGPTGPPGHKGRPGRKGEPGKDGRPGNTTQVEESRIIKEMQCTIQDLITRLDNMTKVLEDLQLRAGTLERHLTTSAYTIMTSTSTTEFTTSSLIPLSSTTTLITTSSLPPYTETKEEDKAELPCNTVYNNTIYGHFLGSPPPLSGIASIDKELCVLVYQFMIDQCKNVSNRSQEILINEDECKQCRFTSYDYQSVH